MTSAFVIGIDVGGTKVLGVAATMPDAVEAGSPEPITHEVPTVGRPMAESIVAVVDELVDRTGRQPAAIGLGLAGYISNEGIALIAPNVASIVGVDLGSVLRERYGVPIAADNDANCAARAAAAIDAPGVAHLVAITLGTGIGGGLIVDGRLVRGAHGFAGEPGHMIVDVGGPVCPCGQRGCWEVLASGSGLGRLARRAVDDGRAGAVLAAAGGDIGRVDGPLVSRLLAEGEPEAAALFDELATWVAVGLVNLANLLDPELIVLGGGLVREGDELLDRIRRELATYPTWAQARDIEVRVSRVGHLSGALGAALAAAELLVH